MNWKKMNGIGLAVTLLVSPVIMTETFAAEQAGETGLKGEIAEEDRELLDMEETELAEDLELETEFETETEEEPQVSFQAPKEPVAIELPLGLKWGMSQEEVLAALDQKEVAYTQEEGTDRILVTSALNYLDQTAAGMTLAFGRIGALEYGLGVAEIQYDNILDQDAVSWLNAVYGDPVAAGDYYYEADGQFYSNSFDEWILSGFYDQFAEEDRLTALQKLSGLPIQLASKPMQNSLMSSRPLEFIQVKRETAGEVLISIECSGQVLLDYIKAVDSGKISVETAESNAASDERDVTISEKEAEEWMRTMEAETSEEETRTNTEKR